MCRWGLGPLTLKQEQLVTVGKLDQLYHIVMLQEALDLGLASDHLTSGSAMPSRSKDGPTCGWGSGPMALNRKQSMTVPS